MEFRYICERTKKTRGFHGKTQVGLGAEILESRSLNKHTIIDCCVLAPSISVPGVVQRFEY